MRKKREYSLNGEFSSVRAKTSQSYVTEFTRMRATGIVAYVYEISLRPLVSTWRSCP